MLPILMRTYDKMVFIHKSKVESGDASVERLINHRELIHNWFYAREWMWGVSLDYAVAKFLSVIPKMFHGYYEGSA
jgi:hypothetical protein